MWNKVTRYQNYGNFLDTCLNHNVNPKGFNLKFHLALNVDNHELQASCMNIFHKTSKELCLTVLTTSQENVRTIQPDLQLSRGIMFNELGHARPTKE